MTDAVRQIACSQCGAPLELHGGHRTRSLSCGYCGALMDTQKDYQVVKSYKDTPRPKTPLKIGLQGTFKDIDFTIIGMVEYVSEDSYYWVDFQLYSPTHGYVWLTYNDGHYVFSRRVREIPKPAVFKGFHPRKTVKAMGKTFQAYEAYSAKITYVEGELTWIAKRGDVVEAVDSIAPPYLFSYETASNELEYNFGEYLQAVEVHKAFNIDPPTHKPEEIHPAQPYLPNAFLTGSFVAAKYNLIFIVCVLIILLFIGGGSAISLNANKQFHLNNAEKMLRLKIEAPVQNSWAIIKVNIYDKATNKIVYATAKEITYYSGYDGGEHWSEGSQKAEVLFKLPKAGDYYLKIAKEGDIRKNTPVTIQLYEGVIISRYFWLLAIFMLAMLAWLPIRRTLFEQKRWQPIVGDDA